MKSVKQMQLFNKQKSQPYPKSPVLQDAKAERSAPKYEILREKYPAEIDCSHQIREYKEKASAIERFTNDAISACVNTLKTSASRRKYMGTNIYNLQYCTNPLIRKEGLRAQEALFKSHFSEQTYSAPCARDVLVFGNISLIIPSMENSLLNALCDEISPGDPSPSNAVGQYDRLRFLVLSLGNLMTYDNAWSSRGDIRNIAYLEEAMHVKSGVCKEYASILYLILKKCGFEDVSLVYLRRSDNHFSGHIVLKVAIGPNQYLADPTQDITDEWGHAMKTRYKKFEQGRMFVMHDPTAAVLRRK